MPGLRRASCCTRPQGKDKNPTTDHTDDTDQIMTSYEKRLLMLLDDYAKRKHQCFVTEMFLNPAKTAYTVCFRPTTAGMDSADRNSCRYCEIEATEALNAGTAAA